MLDVRSSYWLVTVHWFRPDSRTLGISAAKSREMNTDTDNEMAVNALPLSPDFVATTIRASAQPSLLSCTASTGHPVTYEWNESDFVVGTQTSHTEQTDLQVSPDRVLDFADGGHLHCLASIMGCGQ